MIDAHVHLWRLGRDGCTWPTPAIPAIHRDFRLSDWRADGGAGGVVLVQSQEDPADTDRLLHIAAEEPDVVAVVGWTDLHAPDATATIAALARRPKLRALRPMVQDRAADWYDDPALAPAWAAMAGEGLTLDALVRPRHLAALARLAARYPALRVVIDHGAKPVLADPVGWRQDMARLAALPNVRCKLSGLLTERAAGEPVEAIAPAVAALAQLFGPDRLVWGSDWPVLRLAGDYRGWLAQARALVPAAMHDAVFDRAARAAYGLAA